MEEDIKVLGDTLTVSALILSLMVSALILNAINAGTLLWVLYVLEVAFLIIGTTIKGFEEGL